MERVRVLVFEEMTLQISVKSPIGWYTECDKGGETAWAEAPIGGRLSRPSVAIYDKTVSQPWKMRLNPELAGKNVANPPRNARLRHRGEPLLQSFSASASYSLHCFLTSCQQNRRLSNVCFRSTVLLARADNQAFIHQSWTRSVSRTRARPDPRGTPQESARFCEQRLGKGLQDK